MAHPPTVPSSLAGLFGLALVAALVGCEKKISPENVDVANKLQESAQQRKSRWTGVSEGMTEKEVESVLGQPSQRRAGASVTINQPVEIPTVTYVYEQDGQAIELSFLDGKLQGKVPKFGEKIDPRAPLNMSKSPAGNGAPKPGGNGAEADASGEEAREPFGADLSGATTGQKLGDKKFRRALADKIIEEEAKMKPGATGSEPQDDAKKDQR